MLRECMFGGFFYVDTIESRLILLLHCIEDTCGW